MATDRDRVELTQPKAQAQQTYTGTVGEYPEFDTRLQAIERIFAELDKAEGWNGNEAIVARRFMQKIPATVKADLARSNLEGWKLGQALLLLQAREVEKYRKNPRALGFGEIAGAAGGALGQGHPWRSFVLGSETPARLLDEAVSRKVGRSDSLGRHNARALGLEEDSVMFDLVSGTSDAAKIFLLDPLIVFGKLAKLRALKKLPQSLGMLDAAIANPRTVKWAEKMAKVESGAEVYRWARLSGGHVEMDLAQKIAREGDAKKVLNLLGDGAVRGKTGPLPLYPFLPGVKEKAQSLSARLPIVRGFQPVWFDTLDPHAPKYFDDLRAAGNYLFKDTKEVSKRIDDIANASHERRVPLVHKFFDEGITSKLKDAGADDNAIRKAFEKMKDEGGFWGGLDEQAFGTKLLPDGLRPAGEIPIFETQLRYQTPVPSYFDITRLTRYVKKYGKFEVPIEDFVRSIQSPLKSFWLMNPRYIARNAMEEMASMASNPVWGGAYVKELGEWALSATGRAFAAGGRFISKTGRISRVKGTPEVEEIVKAGEKIADEIEIPLRIRSTNLARRYAGYQGPVPEEAVKTARKEGLWDWHAWSYVKREDVGYVDAWHHTVNRQVLGDTLTQQMLSKWDEGVDGARAAGKAWLTDNEWYLRKFKDWGSTPDEMVDAQIEILKRVVPEGLWDNARAGHITREALKANVNLGPEVVWGPVNINNLTGPAATKAVATNMMRKGRNWFFDVSGGAVDALGRVPGYKAAYKTEKARLTKLAKEAGVLDSTVSADDIERGAARFAEKQILKYADNPYDRTRAGEWMASMVGFADAHIRYWKRWGRIAINNPGFAEKTRLLFGAGEDLGWIETDDRGMHVFQIPVMPQFVAKITGFDGAKDWFKLTVGKDVEEEGKVTQVASVIFPKGIPFSVDILPGFMPVMSLPVDWVTMDRPNLQWVRDTVLGGGAGERIDPDRSWTDNLIAHVQTGWVDKLSRAVFPNDRDRMYSNSVKDALAYLAYKGEDISKTEVQEKAKRQARTMWLTRGLTQFISPYSPTAFPFGADVIDDYRKMRTEFGPEIGTANFLDKWGENAFAYTVSKSKTVGAPLAASKAADQFFMKNQPFFEQFPTVGGYFTRDLEGEFDYTAYLRGIRRGQRRITPPAEWVADVMYRQGNREYYEEIKPLYDEAKASGEYDSRALSQWLKDRRQEVDDRFPGWLEAWSAWSQRQTKRDADIAALRAAIDHPSVADSPTAKALGEWIFNYDSALRAVRENGDVSFGSDRYEELRRVLAAEADKIKQQYQSRGFDAIYEFLFRREIEDFEEEGA